MADINMFSPTISPNGCRSTHSHHFQPMNLLAHCAQLSLPWAGQPLANEWGGCCNQLSEPG